MKDKPEVENEVCVNDPAFSHKNGEEVWVAQGFFNKEDYDCFMRRQSDRKK